MSINKTDLYRIDIANGLDDPIGDHSLKIAYGGAQYAPDGTLWSPRTRARIPAPRHARPPNRLFTAVPRAALGCRSFDISDEGRFIAYVLNEAGSSRLKLLDLPGRRTRIVTSLPKGGRRRRRGRALGDVGLTLVLGPFRGEVYSVNPATLPSPAGPKARPGGRARPKVNIEHEADRTASFDGRSIGLPLSPPDPPDFPGARPLIVISMAAPKANPSRSSSGETIIISTSSESRSSIRTSAARPASASASSRSTRTRPSGGGKTASGHWRLPRSARKGRPHRSGADRRRRRKLWRYMCYASAIRSAIACAPPIAWSRFELGHLSRKHPILSPRLRRVEYGDERDPAQRAKLLAIFALTCVRELRLPLMVTTRRQRSEVPASEATRSSAPCVPMRTAWHLLGQDEGHGFAKKANQDYASGEPHCSGGESVGRDRAEEQCRGQLGPPSSAISSSPGEGRGRYAERRNWSRPSQGYNSFYQDPALAPQLRRSHSSISR